jgi:hypothetical protein
MSFVRVAASVVIFTLLSATYAAAKPIAIRTDTNLRKAAGTDGEVLTLIPKGTMVGIGKCSNGWCEASLNGQNGFVIARNVGMAPRRPPPGSDVEEIDDGHAPPPRAYDTGPSVYGPYYGNGPYYGSGSYYGYRDDWGVGRRW